MVKMIDVARHSKVSLKTVSRALNNEPHVQAKTRERVLRSVRELGYTPSVSARSLRSSRSYEVTALATALKNLGIEQGNRVIIYIPMVPQAAFAMLACAPVGAVAALKLIMKIERLAKICSGKICSGKILRGTIRKIANG